MIQFIVLQLHHPSKWSKPYKGLWVVSGYNSKIHFEFQLKSYDNFYFRNTAGVKSGEDNCWKQFKGTFEGHVLSSPILQLSGIQYSYQHSHTL